MAAPWIGKAVGGLIGKGGGGGDAAGGIGNVLGNILQSGSARAGGAAKGAADERHQQNVYNIARNNATNTQYGTQQNALLQALLAQERGALDRYGTRQGATSSALANQSAEGLQRARLGLEAPTARARQSVMGSLMQNLQPSNVQASAKVAPHVPKFSGGLTPAALDPMTREHGGALMKAALEAQLSGSDIPASTDFMGGVLNAPESTDFRSGLLTPPELQGYKQAGKGESIMSGGSVVGGILGDLANIIGKRRGGTDEPVMYAGDYGPQQPPPYVNPYDEEDEDT
jgi:hypothetical protein